MLENHRHLSSILKFLRIAERLKRELRHSWLSNGRQESVAEHTWMMTLFALLTYQQIEFPVDIDRVMKMIIVHDLAEIEVGDIPFTEKSERKQQKKLIEDAAMKKIICMIPKEEAEEIYTLWYEYEEQHTTEAKFVKALDNLEVQIQHNLANLETWEDAEFELVYTKMDKYCMHDSYLRELCDEVKLWSEQEMKMFGVDVQSIQDRIFTS